MPNPSGRMLRTLIAASMLSAIAGFLCGCRPSPELHPIETVEIPFHSRQGLTLSLGASDLEIIGHDQSSLIVSGTSTGAKVMISLTPDQAGTHRLEILPTDPAKHEHTSLTVWIPRGTAIELTQARGTVYAHDFAGKIRIASISADIVLERVNGQVHASTRRGTVNVNNCQGEIDILAEADLITLTALQGSISATNIMGDVRFDGLIGSAEHVRIETDHGSVYISLDGLTDAQIELATAGGDILCTLRSTRGLSKDCEGFLGEGRGLLEVRTVSGTIRIDPTR